MCDGEEDGEGVKSIVFLSFGFFARGASVGAAAAEGGRE